eukprot:1156843-Pelagomonas_calceolata.AAC.10
MGLIEVIKLLLAPKGGLQWMASVALRLGSRLQNGADLSDKTPIGSQGGCAMDGFNGLKAGIKAAKWG